ncbi:hypothetical protein BC830DRAFT_1093673 [Chytriomyces sp. MP71]|nr:hypothetical protein BC830DRAFT_1093673 [Chytriomyces sp. MP71]
MEMTKEIKNLRKEKHEAVEAAKAKAISDAQTIKVEQENTKLRNLAQKDAEKIKKLIERVKSLELTNENLGKEVKQLQRQYKGETSNHHDENDEGGDDNDSETHEKRLHRVKYAEQVAHLKGKLAEKDEIINTLAADGNGSSSSEMRKLRRELEMWKAQCTQVKEQLSQYTASDNVNSGYRPSTRMEANIVELRGGMGEVVVERNALRDRVAELERDVDQLRGELSNFDGSFLDELEDLKNKYREAVKLNIKYEEHIKHLCEACGYSSDRILSNPFGRRAGSGGPSQSREREHDHRRSERPDQ